MTAQTESELRLVDLVGAFATAGELGRGQPVGHLARVCWLSQRIGEEMKLSESTLTDLYYTSLLAHIGCTAGASEFATFLMSDELVAQHDVFLCDPDNLRQVLAWLARHTATGRSRPIRAGLFARALLGADKAIGGAESGCEDVGARIAERLGMSEVVRGGVYNICETWGGKGPRHQKGESIPLVARIVGAAMIIEVLLTEFGASEGREAVRRRRGRSLDPTVVDAFTAIAERSEFMAALEAGGTWEWVRSHDRSSRVADERSIEAAALAFADFGDLKSSGYAAHSRATAALAERIAERLGCSPADVTLARRAALVHAAGHAGVPARLLAVQRSLPLADEERLRMHPLLTERIVERASALAEAGRIAGMHHERLDGTGYPRRLAGAAIPLPARVVAIADAYREMSESPGRSTAPSEALAKIRVDVGAGFDPACFAALEAEVEGRPMAPPRKAPWPADLSDREVEVLRLLGRGLKGKEVARELVVAESTARHHIEHIYNKVGVSSRAGAILFAVENELVV